MDSGAVRLCVGFGDWIGWCRAGIFRQMNLHRGKQICRGIDIQRAHGRNHHDLKRSEGTKNKTKGEDHYRDVCILLNKTTFQKYKIGKLNELTPSTRNRLYVALSRAKGNVYLINEEATK